MQLKLKVVRKLEQIPACVKKLLLVAAKIIVAVGCFYCRMRGRFFTCWLSPFAPSCEPRARQFFNSAASFHHLRT